MSLPKREPDAGIGLTRNARPRNFPAKLPGDAHLSGSIFANTNWLDPSCEFLPAPVPINPRNETIKSRRHRFRRAIFHPHPETCSMFSFISAGSGSAHCSAPWAVGALSVPSVPVGVRLAPYPSKRGYGVRSAGMGRNWNSKCDVKMAPQLASRISAIKSIQVPGMCNPMDNCPEVVRRITKDLGAGRQKKCGRIHGIQYPQCFSPRRLLQESQPNYPRAKMLHDTNSNRRRPRND
jgi:hypothetical protein